MANGTWNVTTTPASWNVAGNWLSSIADGLTSSATFGTNIPVDSVVTLDAARSIGSITFSDGGGAGSKWTVATGTGTNTLTLGTSTITTTTPAEISAAVSSAAAFTKSGLQLLTFSGGFNSTGAVTISQGPVTFSAGLTANFFIVNTTGNVVSGGALNLGASDLTVGSIATTAALELSSNIGTGTARNIFVGPATSLATSSALYIKGGAVTATSTTLPDRVAWRAAAYGYLELTGSASLKNTGSVPYLAIAADTGATQSDATYHGTAVLVVNGASAQVGPYRVYTAHSTSRDSHIWVFNGTLDCTGQYFETARLLTAGTGTGTAQHSIVVGDGTSTATLNAGNAVFLGGNTSASGYTNFVIRTGGTLTAGSISYDSALPPAQQFYFSLRGGTFKLTSPTTAAGPTGTNVVWSSSIASNVSFVVYENSTIDCGTSAITIPIPVKAASGSGYTTFASGAVGSNYIGPPSLRDGDSTGEGVTLRAIWNTNGTITGTEVLCPGFGVSASPVAPTATGGGGSGFAPQVGAVAANSVTFANGRGIIKTGDNALTFATAADFQNTFANLQINAGTVNYGTGIANIYGASQTANVNFGVPAARLVCNMNLTSAVQTTLSGIFSSTGTAGGLSVSTGCNVKLTGANTFASSVATTVASGAVLEIANNSALGVGTAGVTVTSGGELKLSGDISTTTAKTLTISGTGVSGSALTSTATTGNTYSGGLSVGSGGLTIASTSGTLTLSAASHTLSGNLTIGGAGNVTISGDLTESGGVRTLTKNDAGTLQLSGTGTSSIISGTVTLNAGKILLNSANALGPSTNTAAITIASGAELAIGSNVSVAALRSINLNGSGGGFGAITSIVAGAVYSGPITVKTTSSIYASGGGASLTLAGNITLEASLTSNTFTSATVTLSGVISGNFAVTAASSGTTFLTNADNSFTGGVTVSGGSTLSISTLPTSGNSPVGTGSNIRITNGTLTFTNTSSITTGRVIEAHNTGGVTISANSANASAVTLTSDFICSGTGAKAFSFRGASTAINTVHGIIPNASGGAAVAVTISNGGKWEFTAFNTNSGTFTSTGNGSVAIVSGTFANVNTTNVVSTGTLVLKSGSSGARRFSASNTTTVNSGTTLIISSASSQKAQQAHATLTLAGGSTLQLGSFAY